MTPEQARIQVIKQEAKIVQTKTKADAKPSDRSRKA